MPDPHHRWSLIVLLAVSYFSPLLIGFSSDARAQESGPPAGTAQGIELYLQGDAAGAVNVLKEVIKRDPDDADAWYYLGLAFYSQDRIGEARPRFERLIQLRPDSADAHAKLAYAQILANEPQKALGTAQRAIELGDHSPEAHYAIAEANLRTRSDALNPGQLVLAIKEADTALQLNPKFAIALITKSFALYHLKRYAEAATSLDTFLGISPDDVDADMWREQLEQMRARAAISDTTQTATDPTIFNSKTVTQKARVLIKPEPQYTEAARKAGVQGSVILRGVFASDGEVKHISVVQALGFGLTTSAIKAARQIKFQPSIKDDKPVSMYIQLEYNFNLY